MELKPVENENYPVVDPNDVCRYFDRIDASLPEEMETCDLCNFYDENGSRCRNGGKKTV